MRQGHRSLRRPNKGGHRTGIRHTMTASPTRRRQHRMGHHRRPGPNSGKGRTTRNRITVLRNARVSGQINRIRHPTGRHRTNGTTSPHNNRSHTITRPIPTQTFFRNMFRAARGRHRGRRTRMVHTFRRQRFQLVSLRRRQRHCHSGGPQRRVSMRRPIPQQGIHCPTAGRQPRHQHR